MNQDWNPLESMRDAIDMAKGFDQHRNTQETAATRKLLEEQVRLQKEANELEKKRQALEQGRMGQGHVLPQSTIPSPSSQPPVRKKPFVPLTREQMEDNTEYWKAYHADRKRREEAGLSDDFDFGDDPSVTVALKHVEYEKRKKWAQSRSFLTASVSSVGFRLGDKRRGEVLRERETIRKGGFWRQCFGSPKNKFDEEKKWREQEASEFTLIIREPELSRRKEMLREFEKKYGTVEGYSGGHLDGKGRCATQITGYGWETDFGWEMDCECIMKYGH